MCLELAPEPRDGLLGANKSEESLINSTGVAMAKPCLPMAFMGRMGETNSPFPLVGLLPCTNWFQTHAHSGGTQVTTRLI